MSTDFSDIVVGSMVGSTIANSGNQDMMRVESAHQRAKNIEDNFGLKTQSLEEYRDQHGGSGWLKGLAWAAAGIIGAVLLAHALPILAVIAGIGGLIMGGRSMGKQEQNVENGYSQYLDGVSAMGRTGRGGMGVQYDNTPTRNFSSDISAQRAEEALREKTR